MTTGVLCCAGAAQALAACPDANLMPRPGNLERIDTAVVCLVNEMRESHGESPLQPNAQLQAAAQGHSAQMGAEDYFEHVGPDGETPLQRMRASGYVPGGAGYAVGENIAWGTLSLATPKAIVESWVHSPEHLANMLDASFRDTGVGISTHPPASLANGQEGAIYTQDFGVIIKSGAARYNLRSFQPPRSDKGYGSTRRKGRNRHRLGKRHRPRHRGAARRAGRKRAHQRSRRRRR